MNYQNLVNAIQTAIDREADEHDGKFVTDESIAPVEQISLDFDVLMNEFNEIVGKLQTVTGVDFSTAWAPRIVEITDRILGKGKKVAEMSRDQVELLDLILSDLKDAIGDGI